MNISASHTSPYASPDIRIVQLDVLRGVAVLGIYWINVAVFALPYSAYIMPVLMGDATMTNSLVWGFSEVFVDGTMRGLFSMLFGASAMLFLHESRLAGNGVAVVDRFYRRTLLLMLFGLIHAWLLLWPYDVLYAYGLFGLFLFPLRKLSARTLLIAGLALLLLGDLGVADRPAAEQTPPAAGQPSLINFKLRHIDDTPDDDSGNGLNQAITAQLQEEIGIYQSGYLRIFRYQRNDVIEQQSSHIYDTHVFDIGGMMLLGMALFKWGVLSGRRSRVFYLWLALLGYLAGILLRGPAAYAAIISGFNLSRLLGSEAATYNTGRLAMTLGHIGLIMLLYRVSALAGLQRILASIGRLALSNYIMQSLISIFLFYGIGLGLYARFERYQLIFICLGVWLVQIVFSITWLRYFHYGPLEWLWRSLIYGKRQKFRKTSAPAAAVF